MMRNFSTAENLMAQPARMGVKRASTTRGDHAAHEGGGDADFQGAFSLAPQGHWVSVEGRTHRRRGAGNVDEDGGDQAAGDAAHIEAQQQTES